MLVLATFTKESSHWSKDPEYNRIFLQAQQNYFNDKLKIKGYIFLNEVFEALGMQETKAGHNLGWTKYNGLISFDIDPTLSGDICLRFNVTGDITNLIWRDE